jgi:hypothetical protein
MSKIKAVYYLFRRDETNIAEANHLAPSSALIGLYSDQSFPYSFEATPDARCTARHNHVTVGVEDLKRNCIGELVLVITDLDGPREPVCLRPGAGSAKNEGLGHRAVSVAVRVPPDA